MGFKKLAILAFTLTFFLCGFTIAFSADGTIVLKAATTQPRKHPLHDNAYLRWGEEIEKRTNGKVKFKWYLSGSLVKQGQAQTAVKEGLVDVLVQNAVWMEEAKYPVTKLLHIPFMMDSPRHGAQLYYMAYQAIPELRKEHEGVKPLGFFTTGIQNLGRKGKPIKTLNDMKGIKLWTGSKSTMEMVKLLGGTPVMTQVQDVYMSLQRGMVEGFVFPTAPALAFKLTEIANAHTIGNFSGACQYFAMNLKTWKKLPLDVQKVFEDLTQSTGMLAGTTLTRMQKGLLKNLGKRGDKIYLLPPEEKAKWAAKIQPLADSIISDLDKKGIDGQALYKKVMALAEEARQNPYSVTAVDDWWKKNE